MHSRAIINSSTRKLAVGGLLSAISIVMSFTPLGYVPVPTPAGSVTTMHVPVIIAALLEGPYIGTMVGSIFGLTSFIRGANFFVDPVVAIIPRLFIGMGSYFAMRLTARLLSDKTKRDFLPYAAGAFTGTVINTAGVLSLATLRGYLPGYAAAGVAVSHGIPEIIVAIILTILICRTVRKLY
ncbi:ECF transporter S component [Natranaerobius thermophilus]|uniref:Membrane protein n=1 Tax=Natranaerobius thermophilus (strain ATCC BAA-1301 / DSM 18059 / JW/NM-WN-LF) TaxID=457570 RepID=B2A3Q5_NATTJ|nr:ECF transporter S component [Natranaerobius thermophilus]ACB83681.1 membrane protein [Natranaerobius thermophilus JW/NM-WN-LF]